jgi:lipoate-protein ligase A
VDHRADWTYTLAAPAGTCIAGMRGAESYRIVHEALAQALRDEGIDTRLSTGTDLTAAAICFENPVGHDLIDATARKLAGAGQRRTRRGLLHQGSVAAPCDEEISHKRSGRFADLLASQWRHVDLQPPRDWLIGKIHYRYGNPERTKRC